MPEMPEVEQVRKTLAPRITNKKITSVEVYLDRLVKHPTVEKFVEGLTGKSILKLLHDTCKKFGKTVIVITHNTALTAMADHVIYVKNGTVVKEEYNENPMPIESIEW